MVAVSPGREERASTTTRRRIKPAARTALVRLQGDAEARMRDSRQAISGASEARKFSTI
jgi:hypothetical protein